MRSKPIWPIPKIEFLTLGDLRESRQTALVYTRSALEAVRDDLQLPIESWIEIRDADEERWRARLSSVKGEVIYAVGGGLAVDAAKYFAAALALPLVAIPTALSVDAFFTWASGVRVNGCVRYLTVKPPDLVCVDWSVIAAAPESIRAAGICDALSIATGLWDWRYAEERGANPAETRYLSYVDRAARAILEGVMECAEAAGQGDHGGLKQLLDCLALEVQLCNQIGHSRPEEGSEHYFAYAVESRLDKNLPHGDLVGPGILLMAERQGQDVAPLRRALEACRVPLDSIPPDVVEATLRDLPAYCREHRLPHGIAHDWDARHPGRDP